MGCQARARHAAYYAFARRDSPFAGRQSSTPALQGTSQAPPPYSGRVMMESCSSIALAGVQGAGNSPDLTENRVHRRSAASPTLIFAQLKPTVGYQGNGNPYRTEENHT